MITESAIRAAIRKVAAGERPRLELRDSGARSEGRLVLIIRNLGKRTVAEWGPRKSNVVPINRAPTLVSTVSA